MVYVGLFGITALAESGLLHAAASAAPTGQGEKPVAATPEVTLDSIYPTTVYPNPLHKRYDFEIVGQNLGKAEDNVVEVIGEGRRDGNYKVSGKGAATI